MLTTVNPKLPMRSPAKTRNYYVDQLDFSVLADYGDYLIMEKDDAEIHFFLYADLDPLSNYGQIYIRTDDIDAMYAALTEKKVTIHPEGPLAVKPWGQKEFSLLDPDHNLLTFGQTID